MKYIFALLSLVLLFNSVYSQCADSCDEEIEDFFRTTGKCEKFPKSGETGFVDKCDMYNYDNSSKGWECRYCEVQYHYDGNTNTCIDGGIAHCTNYQKNGSTFTCDYCGNGYYLDGQTCTPNPNTVTNCEAYRKENDGKVKCSSCAGDKLYLNKNEETNTCLEFPNTVTGCDYYYNIGNDVLCGSCDDNYDGIIKDGTNQECYKISEKIANCESGTHNQGSFTCNRCKSGMMPNTKANSNDECIANPTTTDDGLVENCDGYRKDISVKCVSCVAGFGLKNDGKCYDVGAAKVENCGIYEFENNKWACETCNDDYYSDDKDNITKCGKCPENKNKKKNSSAELMKVSMVITVIVSVLFL